MIGQKLKKLREETGIKQETLAKAIGLQRQTISMYESDKRDPDIPTLKKIASYFQITVDELLEDVKEIDYEFRYEHNGTKLYHKEKIKK